MAIEDGELYCKMIVLDTDTYAGNFERELCAYVTGQLGDCNVGAEMAEIAEEEIRHLDWWKNNISQQETEDGSEFFRPCTIWITEGITNSGVKVEEGKRAVPPGYFSVAIFVEDFPPPEVLEEMLDRTKKFCSEIWKKHNRSYAKDNTIELTGYRLSEPNIETVLVEKQQVTSTTTKKFKF